MTRPDDCTTKHNWACWWTENVDVCRGCDKEKPCLHKSDAKARREGWFN